MSYQRLLRKMICLGLVTLLPVGCTGGQAEPPASLPPTPTPIPPTAPAPQKDELSQWVQRITWLRSTNPYGHTGIKIQTDARVIYLDPVDLVSLAELPKADLILVTHDHDDHFSPEDISTLSKEGTKVVSIATITDHLDESGGVSTFPVAAGESVQLDAGG